MLLVEVHQELYVGSPPLIDVLIRIPHNHQVPVHAGQDFHQTHFHQGAVLELVHHDVIQPLLPLFPNLHVRHQQIGGKGDQIVEIQ